MKYFTVVFDFVLLAFMGFVLFTDGTPSDPMYTFITIFSVFTLIYSSVILLLSKAKKCRFPEFRWKETGVESRAGQASHIYKNSEIIAFVCNVFFFGFVCWALLNQGPHPEESGIVAFAVMMITAPVLNLLALLCCKI